MIFCNDFTIRVLILVEGRSSASVWHVPFTAAWTSTSLTILWAPSIATSANTSSNKWSDRMVYWKTRQDLRLILFDYLRCDVINLLLLLLLFLMMRIDSNSCHPRNHLFASSGPHNRAEGRRNIGSRIVSRAADSERSVRRVPAATFGRSERRGWRRSAEIPFFFLSFSFKDTLNV